MATAAKAAEEPKSIWTPYKVTFDFVGKLCASVPANPELIAKWLESRQPKVFPPGGRTIAEIQEEIVSTLAEGESEEQRNLLIFQRMNGELMMRAATVRAHIKDCARVLSAQYIGKVQGERAFSTRIINGVYHDPAEYWLPLRRDGIALKKADGIQEKAVHFRNPRTGQDCSALKGFEYVENASMQFTLKVLGKSASRDDLETVFSYGGVHGYGGERGDGEGRYTFTIKENT